MSFIKIKVYNSEEEASDVLKKPLGPVNIKKLINLESDLESSASAWFWRLRFNPRNNPSGIDLTKFDWEEVVDRIKEVIALPNIVDSLIFIGVDDDSFEFLKFNDS